MKSNHGLTDITPQYSGATLARLGKRGAAMSVIFSFIDLLYREYFKTKLQEMNALPHLPPGT